MMVFGERGASAGFGSRNKCDLDAWEVGRGADEKKLFDPSCVLEQVRRGKKETTVTSLCF